MSTVHVIVEGRTAADYSMAKQFAEALIEAYPGHPWHVDVRDGLILLKHMRLSGKWAQVKHMRNLYSASDLKNVAVRLGGEFLERAGMSRGPARDDEYMRIVDGIPTKDLLLA